MSLSPFTLLTSPFYSSLTFLRVTQRTTTTSISTPLADSMPAETFEARLSGKQTVSEAIRCLPYYYHTLNMNIGTDKVLNPLICIFTAVTWRYSWYAGLATLIWILLGLHYLS